MSNWLDRVSEERDDLIGKIKKLGDFMGKDESEKEIGKAQFALLRIQRNIMLSYIEVLNARIRIGSK